MIITTSPYPVIRAKRSAMRFNHSGAIPTGIPPQVFLLSGFEPVAAQEDFQLAGD
jgi:hypothetical protein